LCSGTGSWEAPYVKAGYDVRVITLPEHDVLAYEPPDSVYGVLAAPPCREFSLCLNMKNRHMKNKPIRDIKKGLETVRACQRIINQSSCKFYAIENPVGLLSKYLGKPNFTFHPWMFGDPWTKRTAIWGKFNNPSKSCQSKQECLDLLGENVIEYFRKRKICGKPRKGSIMPSRADMDMTHFTFTGMKEERSAFRAITPPGFADAFFKANR